MQDFSPDEGKTRIKIKGSLHRIFENGWLKIISLGLAIALWLFVTNFQDPETVLTINNVPVRILHMNTVTSEGKTCIVLDDSDTIPVVTISAPRSVVDALSSDNVIATADVEKMEEDNMVPIDITTNKYSDSIKSITSSIRYVRLSIEDESTATFNIDLSVKGKVADGSQIGQITLEQNQVRVTGPASEVALVSSAGVVVDVSDTENNISTNSEIHLYDAEGNDIRLDKNLSLNIDKTMVRVELLTLKQIPVKIAVSGTPADGYRLTGETSVEPGRITIAAKKGVLDSVSAVSIPSAELNVTNRTKTLVRNFVIANYLPDGVITAEGETDTVKVTVEIVPTETEEVTN